MLRTRGGNRFEGYGNVKVATNHGTRAGWQLICYECQKLSEVIHRTGQSYPPKVLVKLFSDKGWKVGSTSASDVCPACLDKRRQRAREERKQYAKGNVDRLLDMIRQIDLMLASNVTIDYGPYQPQIAAQLKSLFETAYLCGMLPSDLIRDVSPAPAPEPEPWPPNEALMLADKVLSGEMSIHDARELFNPEQSPEPEPPSPEPPPKPSPPPVPPAQGERISPRTAAFLAQVRKQVFKGAAA